MFYLLKILLILNAYSLEISDFDKVDKFITYTKIKITQEKNFQKKMSHIQEIITRLDSIKAKTKKNYKKYFKNLRHISHLKANLKEINSFPKSKCEYKRIWIIGYNSPRNLNPSSEQMPRYTKIALSLLKLLCK